MTVLVLAELTITVLVALSKRKRKSQKVRGSRIALSTSNCLFPSTFSTFPF